MNQYQKKLLRRLLPLLLILSTALCGQMPGNHKKLQAPPSQEKAVSNEFIIRFKDGIEKKEIIKLLASLNCSIVQLLGPATLNQYLVKINNGRYTDIEAALKKNSSVILIQPNYKYELNPIK